MMIKSFEQHDLHMKTRKVRIKASQLKPHFHSKARSLKHTTVKIMGYKLPILSPPLLWGWWYLPSLLPWVFHPDGWNTHDVPPYVPSRGLDADTASHPSPLVWMLMLSCTTPPLSWMLILPPTPPPLGWYWCWVKPWYFWKNFIRDLKPWWRRLRKTKLTKRASCSTQESFCKESIQVQRERENSHHVFMFSIKP